MPALHPCVSRSRGVAPGNGELELFGAPGSAGVCKERRAE